MPHADDPNSGTVEPSGDGRNLTRCEAMANRVGAVAKRGIEQPDEFAHGATANIAAKTSHTRMAAEVMMSRLPA